MQGYCLINGKLQGVITAIKGLMSFSWLLVLKDVFLMCRKVMSMQCIYFISFVQIQHCANLAWANLAWATLQWQVQLCATLQEQCQLCATLALHEYTGRPFSVPFLDSTRGQIQQIYGVFRGKENHQLKIISNTSKYIIVKAMYRVFHLECVGRKV